MESRPPNAVAFHGDRLFVSHSAGQSAKQKACPRETPVTPLPYMI